MRKASLDGLTVLACGLLAGCALPALSVGVRITRAAGWATTDERARSTHESAAVAWFALGFALERVARHDAEALDASRAKQAEDGSSEPDVDGVFAATADAALPCAYPDLCAWEAAERAAAWSELGLLASDGAAAEPARSVRAIVVLTDDEEIESR